MSTIKIKTICSSSKNPSFFSKYYGVECTSKIKLQIESTFKIESIEKICNKIKSIRYMIYLSIQWEKINSEK